MPTTSLNPLQPASQSSSLSTRFVRTSSAPDAQGFAQILQAFEPAAGSSVAESIKDSQQESRTDQLEADEVADEKSAGDQVDESESKNADGESANTPGSGAESQSDASGLDASAQSDIETSEPVDTNSLDSQAAKNGASSGQGGEDGSLAVDQTQAGQSVAQPTLEGDEPAQEAVFRLLENQSDQAKLTIKGVVLGLTHAADANVTAQAVQIRIGAETNGQTQSNQSFPVVPQPTQQNTEQEVVADGQAKQESARQFGQPTDAARANSLNASQELSSNDHRRVVSQSDQSTVDAQLGRGQRSESAIAASASQQAASSTVRSAGVSPQAPSQLIEIGRSNTAQTTRGVARVEAGLIGSQPRETLPGSLAEKVKTTQLPDQAKRAHVLAQVQRGLASMLRSGKNDMTLKLTPGHLGEIRIQLKSDGDQLSIRFETSSKEANEHLRESVKELGVNLRAKGISLDKIEVEQSLTPDSSKAGSSDTAGANADGQSDSATSGQHDQGSGQHAGSDQSDDLIEQAIDADEPESIWTDIGLDALA